MNPADDLELVQLFVDESLEGLQRVEKILLAAEEGSRPASWMDTMFRDFHTIKGTAALLAFERTARVAHAAEDLMSALRDGTLQPQARQLQRMVEVVDTLGALIQSVNEGQKEAEVDVEDLVGALRAELNASGAPPPPGATAASPPALPPPSAPPPPAPAAEQAPTSSPSFAPLPSAPLPEPVHDEHPGEAARGEAHKAETADNTVRVNVGLLDKLMNLMGELVLARNQLVQSTRSVAEPQVQASAARLSLVTTELQDQIMKTRMQPVSRVFEKIPRLVRDLCKQTGKKVVASIAGNATELDKTLVEATRDPLVHMVRNSMDHGFESPEERVSLGKPPTGTLTIRAAHVGGMVVIEVEDDGRGVDPVKVRRAAVRKGMMSEADAARLSDREAVELIFQPAFSTAEKVTTISGRGVGMDVVRTSIERAGGTVEMESKVGKGTLFRLKLPLTLAIIPALIVEDDGQRFALPQASLSELVYLEAEEAARAVEWVRGAPVFRLRGELLPLVELGRQLGWEPQPRQDFNLVVVAAGRRRYGLLVQAIHDTEEIVIKPLHPMLKKLSCYTGVAVLGDGGMALILDVSGLAAMAGLSLQRGQDMGLDAAGLEAEQQSMLVFQAGELQCAVPVAAVSRLEQVPAAHVEALGEGAVLQYRGQVMQVLRLERLLPTGGPRLPDEGLTQLVVFNFGRAVGVVVDRIIDVVDLPGLSLGNAELPHTLGTIVVNGRTTVLLDIFGVIRALSPVAVAPPPQQAAVRPRVLLADELDALRVSLAGYLRAGGYEVVEVGPDGLARELKATEQRGFDAVLAGPSAQGLEPLRSFASEHPQLKVLCLADGERRPDAAVAGMPGSLACVEKREREAVLAALDEAGLRPARRAQA